MSFTLFSTHSSSQGQLTQSSHTTFSLHVVNDLPRKCSLLRKTHLARESGMWDPFAGSPRSRLFQHAVDLFQGEPLGLGDEEVGVNEAAAAKGAPDEEDPGAQVALVGADHVGGDDSDDLEYPC